MAYSPRCTASKLLPAAEKNRLDLGYLRLSDAAPLIVAREQGFCEAYGLHINLHREVSWANVRDKLVSGDLDAAQMLAPLPAMTSLGVSGVRAALLAGLVLSRNGNAITLAEPLWRMRHRLREALAARSYAPTFATVHAFSTHTVLLRRWLRGMGLNPDVDVRTIVVPPSQVVDSLAAGVIDGFCAGEPWNSIAVRSRVGGIAALGRDIWPGAPEKVLSVSAAWHQRYPHTHQRLRLALLAACRWVQRAENRAAAAALLAQPSYLDLPRQDLLPALSGNIQTHWSTAAAAVPDFYLFHGATVNAPRAAESAQLINECAQLLGKPVQAAAVRQLAAGTSRADLFEETVSGRRALCR